MHSLLRANRHIQVNEMSRYIDDIHHHCSSEGHGGYRCTCCKFKTDLGKPGKLHTLWKPPGYLARELLLHDVSYSSISPRLEMPVSC